MGIRYLEKFVRTQVPDGCIPVNIKNEIRKASNRSPPTIVIHFQSLFQPVSEMDLAGVLCGGRFEFAYQIVEQFLSQLYCLGATLVFFANGPPVGQCTDSDSWIDGQCEKYERQTPIIDAIDRDEELRVVVNRNRWNIPINTMYPLKTLARRYGQFKTSTAKKCRKEMVAYANSVQAMAIISNDTDHLIYSGNWRFWSAKDLNFEKCTTVEFSRSALVSHLALRVDQMPLFATLGGNGIIRYEEVLRLHSQMGTDATQKFYALATLVRRSTGDLVSKVFGEDADEDVRLRFQESLDSYDTNKLDEKQSFPDDPTLDYLVKQGRNFMCKIWINFPMHVSAPLVDMRDDDLGAKYSYLAARIILREAAVILYHRKDEPDCRTREVVIKPSHDERYVEQRHQLVFPQGIEVPTLLDLLSKDPELRAELFKTKFRLYCWIVADKLDPDRLEAIPRKMLPTVLTLYYLRKNRILELFEADLLLQVAHDVAFNKYSIFEKRYPPRLDKRAFRVAMLYTAINKHVSKALKVVGLDFEGFANYPQFDGMRFHNLYPQWKQNGGNLKLIKEWRIYEKVE